MAIQGGFYHAPQVKTLRVLQYFPAPEDAGTKRTLNEILKKIINSAPSLSTALSWACNTNTTPRHTTVCILPRTYAAIWTGQASGQLGTCHILIVDNRTVFCKLCGVERA